MAVYRQIQTTFWQDSFVLELTPEEKYFYLYLITNPKTSASGVYELPKKVIELETGYNRETVDKLLSRFVEYGKILYDEVTKEIILVNWLKYNNWKSPKTQTCIHKELEMIKSDHFKSLVKTYLTDTLSIPHARGINTPSIPHGSKDIDIDIDKELDIDIDEKERKLLHLLKSIDNWPFDYVKDLDYLRSLLVDFPKVDLLEEIQKYKTYKLDKPLKKDSNARLQLRNWCVNAVKFRKTEGQTGEREFKFLSG